MPLGDVAGAIFPADVDPHAGPLTFYEVRAGDEGPELAVVPRWLVPDVVARPQPRPIRVYLELTGYLKGRFTREPGDRGDVFRTWRAEDVPHCRLCSHCSAHWFSKGREYECRVEVPEDNFPTTAKGARRHARYWSERHQNPLPLAERAGKDGAGC